MTIFEPIFLTVSLGTFTHTVYNSKSCYSKGGMTREVRDGYYLNVVDKQEATHFILLDNEEGEKLPEWTPVVSNIPTKYIYSFNAYGKVYPIEGLETVLRLAQEAEDKFQSELQAYEAKKAKEEERKKSFRPMIEAFFLDNKDKGSFSLYDRGNSIQVRHIHWTTSETINYDRLEEEGTSYLNSLINKLVSKRNQVAECWDKEAQRDSLKEAVSFLLPEELTVSGNNYKVFIRPTIPLPGDNVIQVNNLDEVPGIVTELLLRIKEYEALKVQKDALRKANKPIPKALRR